VYLERVLGVIAEGKLSAEGLTTDEPEWEAHR
jgi:hypothetical protein